MAPLEGKTANTPRLGPVSTSRQRIAELARQAVGMAVAIAWLPGPAGTRRRVAKLSVEEPDAAEPARPDLWGARVSNDPGLPDPSTGWPKPPFWLRVTHQPSVFYIRASLCPSSTMWRTWSRAVSSMPCRRCTDAHARAGTSTAAGGHARRPSAGLPATAVDRGRPLPPRSGYESA